jgi:O-antigen/teichoic acid export membrane protein
MKQVQFYAKPTSRAFGTTAISATIHIFGALTCATCWTIFGPALAVMFGSAGTALLATLRPFAPLAVVFSAIGLAYSVYTLVRNRDSSAKLPYRMAAAFTILSVFGWVGSAAYTVLTLVKG